MKKIMICCSSKYYDNIKDISDYLISNGYEVVYPNGYGEKYFEVEETQQETSDKYKEFYNESINKINGVDEILVLNYDKEKAGVIFKNYIGPSTFLEMYQAFITNKKIYLLNNLPDKDFVLYDDIYAMMPIELNGNIETIR